MTIAALRALLDQELPDVPRHPAPRLHLPPWTAKEPPDMDNTPEQAPVAPAPTPLAPVSDMGQLFDWAGDHADPEVQALGEQARKSVAALWERRRRDIELAKVDAELAEVEARAAELRARQAELQPPAKRRPPTYNAALVRAWARGESITVPAVGRVPADVVAAWRTATGRA